MQTIFRNPSELKSYVLPNPERCNVPASTMLVSNDSIVVVDINVPAAHVALHQWQPNTPDGQGTPFLFHHGRNAASSTSGAFMRMFKGSTSSGEDYEFPRAIAFAASAIRSSAIVAVTCDKDIITGDYFSYCLYFGFIICILTLPFEETSNLESPTEDTKEKVFRIDTGFICFHTLKLTYFVSSVELV
jgi:hypothetical protein